VTVKQKRALTLGVVAAILAGVLTPTILGAARTAWDAKVSTTRYELDRRSDSLWRIEQRAMTLDVLCSATIDPTNRRCR